MTLISKSRRLSHAAFAVFISASSCLLHAQASVETTTPAAPIGYFPYSTLSSANDIVYATRLPVKYNGKTYYEDATITLKFEVSSTGEVTATAEPVLVASPTPIANKFIPGTYVGPSNVNGGKSIITVSGPSTLSGGATEWNISLGSGASANTWPDSADWYVESSLGNNPIASRLKAAGITSTVYSYGIGDSGTDYNNWWPNNAILGFSQVGNVLTVYSFTSYDPYNGMSYDQPNPVDQITYTLKQ